MAGEDQEDDRHEGAGVQEQLGKEDKTCQLCGMTKLEFEQPDLCCFLCGNPINEEEVYYSLCDDALSSDLICVSCYAGEGIAELKIGDISIEKSKLEMRKNDAPGPEEEWVECHSCKAGQHIICALYNKEMNDEGHYTCPHCYMISIESGKHAPLPSILGAADLPTTSLSDHIEKSLASRLEGERQKRAVDSGLSVNEVPTAEDLAVRVVSSVDRTVRVNDKFRRMLASEGYAPEISYRSKAIALFQKIDGVDVLLSVSYVQEYGSTCHLTNERHIYMSYLDSVSYFHPPIRAVTGESLRTLVYHGIMIAYLDYVKKRGFTNCYIWSNPPVGDEKYIFNCRPKSQQIPLPNQLRNWYRAVLAKACNEDIVVGVTNFYHHFFQSTSECRPKLIAKKLSFLYEDIFYKTIEKAVNLMDNDEVDILLKRKMEEQFSEKKDYFIVIHLQHICCKCSKYIISGLRWDCTRCKNYHLCSDCQYVEETAPENDKHPHELYSVEVICRGDVEDPDDDMNTIFKSREDFLLFCKKKNYQYDTLRRAKYSSMMVLHHMHRQDT